MVVDQISASDDTDRLFQALADPTRREIVTIVLGEEQSVSSLARRYPMSFAAVQKHVAVLERARLVTKRRQGREQLVSGNIDRLRDAHRALEQLELVWRGRVERMEQILRTDGNTADRGSAEGEDTPR